MTSSIINGKVIFGNYPTIKDVEILEANGVTLFIDLTTYKEGEPMYNVSQRYINFPLEEGGVPSLYGVFYRLVARVLLTLSDGDKVYVHGNGGIDTVQLVVSTILGQYCKNVERAIKDVERVINGNKCLDRLRGMNRVQERYVTLYSAWVRSKMSGRS